MEVKIAIKFFKSDKGYKRVFEELRKKWISYGRTAGNIEIKNPSAEEINAVKRFLGKNIDEEKIKFKMKEFEKALKESSFGEIELKELLEEYFQEKIITNKEKESMAISEKERFFQKIIERLKNEKENTEEAAFLLNKIIEEKNSIWKDEKGEEVLFYSIQAINFLKNFKDKIKLAVLGAKISLNPHYFDRGTAGGKLLIQFLVWLYNFQFPTTSEEYLEVYYKAGIETDSISSFTTAYGISLYTEKGIHQGYEELIKEQEIYLLTLSNLKKIVRAQGKNKKIFIIENQMVFSYLCEYFQGKNISMICTSGQLKTASLILVDLLCKEECEIFYSGDIDPEGIEIADKLISRSGNKIIPWCYTVEDYEKSISNRIVSEESLKKLDKIKNPYFKTLIERVTKEKRAGYQESLIEKMIEDIKLISL